MSRPVRTLAALGAAAALVAIAVVSLAGCSSVPDPSASVPRETTETTVYYATGRSILAEKTLADAADPYASTLAVLLKAEPTTEKNVAIVQPTAKVLGVTVKNGLATVDWDKAVLGFQATDSEKRLVYAAILMTFGQFRDVKTVRFTVEGKTSGTIGGKSIADFWGAVSLKDQPWKVIRVGAAAAFDTTPTPTPGGMKK